MSIPSTNCNRTVIQLSGADFFFASPCADGRRLGCQDLLATIEKIKPKIHAFGHIHEGYGVLEKNSTIFVNAYNIDEHYRMKNPPIVLEI